MTDEVIFRSRRSIEADRSKASKRQPELEPPQAVLGQSQPAANDNGMAWPFIPFPEGWYGA
jgi:hypothetical protein